MEDNVRKELETLKGMLENWKAGFLSWASPDGDNEHVLLEFTEDIQANIYPFVKRLHEAEYLSEQEAKEFMVFCFGQVEDLHQKLNQAQTDQCEKEV